MMNLTQGLRVYVFLFPYGAYGERETG